MIERAFNHNHEPTLPGMQHVGPFDSTGQPIRGYAWKTAAGTHRQVLIQVRRKAGDRLLEISAAAWAIIRSAESGP